MKGFSCNKTDVFYGEKYVVVVLDEHRRNISSPV